MSQFKQFMKQNKEVRENCKYAATKSIKDEDGNPVFWEIRPLSSKENNKLRDDCTLQVPVTGKKGLTRPQLDMSKYTARLICASVVVPNLNDKELQDSYNVMSDIDLLYALVDEPAEFSDFSEFIQTFNGFTLDINDKVDDAKK